jgi:rare lipoprotein A
MRVGIRATALVFICMFVLLILGLGCKYALNTFRAKCDQTGIASWYGTNMKGKKTASGERYDPQSLTAASRTYPFGTELTVTNLKNDHSVTVTVNDRSPYVDNRIIDMSVAAANQLGMKKDGIVPVCVQVSEKTDSSSDPKTP